MGLMNGSPIMGAASGPAADALIGGATPLAWFQAASPVLSAVLGGGQQAPTSATSSASSYTSASFDNSGWTVATGSAKATATPPLGINWTTLAIAACIGLLIWKKA